MGLEKVIEAFESEVTWLQAAELRSLRYAESKDNLWLGKEWRVDAKERITSLKRMIKVMKS